MANRRKQIEALQKKASEFAEEIEVLKSELEDAFENMPESLRYNSEQSQTMEDRIEFLDQIISELTNFAEGEPA